MWACLCASGSFFVLYTCYLIKSNKTDDIDKDSDTDFPDDENTTKCDL